MSIDGYVISIDMRDKLQPQLLGELYISPVLYGMEMTSDEQYLIVALSNQGM